MAVGGFNYMTDERIEEVRMEMVRRYSDLKMRCAVIEERFSEWRKLFDKAAHQLSSSLITYPEFDFATLPDPIVVAEAWKEFREARAEVGRLAAKFKEVGLQI